MCGIAGAFGFELGSDINSRVTTALHSMNKRGPDHAEYQLVKSSGDWRGIFAHARLSIIDLYDYSNQPMFSTDGRWALVFNGEIYNYIELRDAIADKWSFKTDSDTEVLLAMWVLYGSACLPKLKGMFAFAIYDSLKQKLVCVRDAFGIKPFYYKFSKLNFFFASEIKPVTELANEELDADLDVAYQYLVHGNYGSGNKTFIEQVKQLEPGQILTVSFDSAVEVEIAEWWTPKIKQTFTGNYEDATKAIRDQFLKDLKMHLRSDVSIGAALSGGIDSSSIVCAMRYVDPSLKINTFSYVPQDERISEEKWVNLINEYVDAIGHKVTFTESDLFADIEDLIITQGEPFGSTSIYAQYRVYKLAKEHGVTVTLDGQGADEIFAGYQGYPGYRGLSLLAERKPLKAIKFLSAWRKWPGRSYAQVILDIARAKLPNFAFGIIRRLAGRAPKPNWLNTTYFKNKNIDFREARVALSSKYSRRRMVERLSSSINGRSLPSLLRHGDRNSMRFSVESRVPFLTIELCDLAYSLPEEYLISQDGETKHIFKDAMAGIVPRELLDRKDKVGFVTPEETWFKNNRLAIIKLLSDVDCVPFLNSSALLKEAEKILSGERRFDWTVWRWVNYIQWYKIFIYSRKKE